MEALSKKGTVKNERESIYYDISEERKLIDSRTIITDPDISKSSEFINYTSHSSDYNLNTNVYSDTYENPLVNDADQIIGERNAYEVVNINTGETTINVSSTINHKGTYYEVGSETKGLGDEIQKEGMDVKISRSNGSKEKISYSYQNGREEFRHVIDGVLRKSYVKTENGTVLSFYDEKGKLEETYMYDKDGNAKQIYLGMEHLPESFFKDSIEKIVPHTNTVEHHISNEIQEQYDKEVNGTLEEENETQPSNEEVKNTKEEVKEENAYSDDNAKKGSVINKNETVYYDLGSTNELIATKSFISNKDIVKSNNYIGYTSYKREIHNDTSIYAESFENPIINENNEIIGERTAVEIENTKTREKEISVYSKVEHDGSDYTIENNTYGADNEVKRECINVDVINKEGIKERIEYSKEEGLEQYTYYENGVQREVMTRTPEGTSITYYAEDGVTISEVKVYDKDGYAEFSNDTNEQLPDDYLRQSVENIIPNYEFVPHEISEETTKMYEDALNIQDENEKNEDEEQDM